VAWPGRVKRLNRSVRREYAQPATYYDAANQPTEVRGIFSRTFVSIDPGTGATISSEQPNLAVRLSDLPEAPAEGRLIEVEGEPLPFTISEVRRDGQGMAVLVLYEEQADTP
jgi:hypothetical protein